MRLRALRLWNVRKFANRGIAIEGIGDGVNVLSAENEYGKSTSFDALHALFFQPHSGTPKSVQMLRPYSSGSPQIEVDVETASGVFRINKQYYSGRRALVTDLSTGRIVAQADEAEAWISDLVRGGVSGPAGLLWVQQGVTDIGGGSTREKDEEKKAREDVLTSVTGDEVELLTGGRRMVRALSKTTSNLEKLVTPSGKQAKAGGPYANSLNELEKLRSEEVTLSSQIDELRAALDIRRQKTARLTELNDPDAAERRNQDKVKALDALNSARAHADKLAIAVGNEKLAASKHQSATDKLTIFEEQLHQASELKHALVEDEANYSEAVRVRDEASNADKLTQSALESSEEKLNAARVNLDEARSVQLALKALSELEKIRGQLVKAEDARSRIEPLTAEHDVLKLSDDVVTSLEELEHEIAVLTASVLAESVALKIDYLDEDSERITRNGAPVSGGEGHKISSTEIFDIPNIGRLAVSPGSGTSSENSRSALRESEKSLRTNLNEYGLDDVSAAKARQKLAQEKASALREAKAELAALAPEGINVLRHRKTDLEAKAESAATPVVDQYEAQAQ